MLKDRDSSAIVAVSDIGRARNFYAEILGLEPAEGGGGDDMLVFRTGATRLCVYGHPWTRVRESFEPPVNLLGDVLAIPEIVVGQARNRPLRSGA